MTFDSKSAKKAGKKSKRGPVIKQEPSIKEKMELLYEKVLDDLLKNQDKLTKTELMYDISNELYSTRVIRNERFFVFSYFNIYIRKN